MNNDLISRSALLEEFDWLRMTVGSGSVSDIDDAIERIKKAPAVDAEPVRHGRWGTYHITGYDGLHPTYTVPCLECSYEATFTHRFCPNCGAMMRR